MRLSRFNTALALSASIVAASCAKPPPAAVATLAHGQEKPAARVQDPGLAIAVDIVLARLRTAGNNEAQIKAAAPQIYDLAAALMPAPKGAEHALAQPAAVATGTPPAHIIHASLSAVRARDESGPEAAIGPARSLFYAIHLGSYRSAARAFTGFEELRGEAPQVLGALSPRVEKVDLGPKKGIYQRLKAGPFDTREAANKACRQLRGQGLYCGVADFTGVAATG